MAPRGVVPSNSFVCHCRPSAKKGQSTSPCQIKNLRHPLVIMNVSDQWTRTKMQQNTRNPQGWFLSLAFFSVLSAFGARSFFPPPFANSHRRIAGHPIWPRGGDIRLLGAAVHGGGRKARPGQGL